MSSDGPDDHNLPAGNPAENPAEAIIMPVALKTVSFQDCKLVVRIHKIDAPLTATMTARLVKRE